MKGLARKGIVFTLMSVLIALSMFSLLTNYRLFVSELESETSNDVGIPQTFLYVGSHAQKIADTDVRVTFNRTHTFINFTDRAPRNASYGDALEAYAEMMEEKLNLSYTFDFNETVPIAEPVFDIGGLNAEYNYSNFTKHNISILQKEADTEFLERYDVEVEALDPAVSADHVIVNNEVSGEMDLHISTPSESHTSSISRTAASTYTINFTGSSGTVNITAGLVHEFNSSLRVDPREKVWINTSMTARSSRLPT